MQQLCKLALTRAGGLSEEVTESTLRAAFVPFGDISEIQIPQDYSSREYPCRSRNPHTGTEEHRGFGFVEFFSEEDAADALDNMVVSCM